MKEQDLDREIGGMLNAPIAGDTDPGFTLRVLASLPPRKRRRRHEHLVVGAMALFSCALAIALTGDTLVQVVETNLFSPLRGLTSWTPETGLAGLLATGTLLALIGGVWGRHET